MIERGAVRSLSDVFGDYLALADQRQLPFRLTVTPPPPELAHHIEGWLLFEHRIQDATRCHYARLPDGATHLAAIEFGEPGCESRFVFQICGAHGSLHPIPLAHAHRALIMRVRPGAFRSLFGIPANEFTDQEVPIQDVLGAHARSWMDRMSEVDWNQRVALLSRFVQRMAHRSDHADHLTTQALAAIERDARATRASLLAQRLGYSNRHLQRVFRDCVGLSPKQFLQTTRIARALRFTRPGVRPIHWAQIAQQSGYYDHAHLIRDFHSCVRASPRRLLASTPFPDTLTGRVLLQPVLAE